MLLHKNFQRAFEIQTKSLEVLKEAKENVDALEGDEIVSMIDNLIVTGTFHLEVTRMLLEQNPKE